MRQQKRAKPKEQKGSMLDSPSFFSSSKAGEGVGHELRVTPFKRNAVQTKRNGIGGASWRYPLQGIGGCDPLFRWNDV